MGNEKHPPAIDWLSFAIGVMSTIIAGVIIDGGWSIRAPQSIAPGPDPAQGGIPPLSVASVMRAGSDADGDPRCIYSFEPGRGGPGAIDCLLSDRQVDLLCGMLPSGYAVLPPGGAREDRAHRIARLLVEQGLLRDDRPGRVALTGIGRAAAEELANPRVKRSIARSREKQDRGSSEFYLMDGIELAKPLPHRDAAAPATGKLKEYLEQLVRLHAFIRAGELETEAAALLSDEMDDTGKHLDAREAEIAREVSAMLYRIHELDLIDSIKRH